MKNVYKSSILVIFFFLSITTSFSQSWGPEIGQGMVRFRLSDGTGNGESIHNRRPTSVVTRDYQYFGVGISTNHITRFVTQVDGRFLFGKLGVSDDNSPGAVQWEVADSSRPLISAHGGAVFTSNVVGESGYSVGIDYFNIGTPTQLTTTTTATPETALRLFRVGKNSVKWNPSADFQIGTYADGLNAQTKLNIRLGNGGTNTPETDIMSLQGNGNVGIGTTNPTSTLHVYGNFLKVERPNGIIMTVNGSNTNGWMGTTSNHGMWLGTNNDGKMWIGADGNAGIGTSTPGAKLEVAGQLKITGGTPGNGKVLTSDANGLASWQTAGSSIGTVLDLGATISGREGNAGKIGYQTFTPDALDIVGAGTTGSNRKIKFWNEGGATFSGRVNMTQTTTLLKGGGNTATTGNEQLLFGYNGTATYMHGIRSRHNGGGQAGNALDFYTWKQGTDTTAANPTQHVMTLDGNGNVGIGTTTPTSTLHVYGDFLKVERPNGIIMTVNGSNTNGWMGTTSNHGMWLGTNNNGKMWIGADGNVGIGTSTPGAKLEVAGQLKITSGTPGNGKVLTSDANGLASWQTPAGSSIGTVLDLGSTISGRNADAGKIGYQTFTSDALDIVGAGTSGTNRKIKFWNEGGATFSGGVNMTQTTTLLKGGSNTATTGNEQILFSYNGTANYMHAIRSRHNSNGMAGNALDFYTWKQGTDATAANPTQHVMTLDGNGNVGIGTTTPTYKLEVRGGPSVFYPNGNTGGQIMIGNSSSTSSFPNAGWIGTINNYGLYIGTNNNANNMYLDTDNNVYIGFSAPFPTVTNVKSKYDLFVNAGVLSQDYALAPVSSWSDYVFEKGYDLKKLSDLEAYIHQNKHLPNIPSQAQIAKDGYSVHEMNTKFLEKIEELTLHVIEQNKEIEHLKKQVHNYQSLSEELQVIKSLLNKK